MDRNCYLRRIGVTEKAIRIDEATLIQLHESHVFNVPFENLDIHYKRLFDLEPRNVYNKVVADSRGGFCYELNSLFNWLLCGLGFKSKNGERFEKVIGSDEELRFELKEHFAIVMR